MAHDPCIFCGSRDGEIRLGGDADSVTLCSWGCVMSYSAEKSDVYILDPGNEDEARKVGRFLNSHLEELMWEVSFGEPRPSLERSWKELTSQEKEVIISLAEEIMDEYELWTTDESKLS